MVSIATEQANRTRSQGDMVVGGKVKKPGKRGRKPAKIDLKAKLERSRQSARECRARKKLRYQYLEELVSSRERAICALREELEMYKQWCMAMDQGKIPSEIKALLTGEEQGKAQQNSTKLAKAAKTEANSSNPFNMINVQEVIFEDAVVLRATPSASLFLQKKTPYKPKNEDSDKDTLNECERPNPCSPPSCFPPPLQTLPCLSTDRTQPYWVEIISKL
ncbi:cAMP-responsive element-binding protein-like 2, partial [Lamprotornis superbus]